MKKNAERLRAEPDAVNSDDRFTAAHRISFSYIVSREIQLFTSSVIVTLRKARQGDLATHSTARQDLCYAKCRIDCIPFRHDL